MLQMENKYDAAFTIIKAAFDKGQITEEQYYKAREKYADISKGKKAEVGETRTWGKIKMQKTASGWVPVSEGKKGKEGEDDKEKTETEKLKTFPLLLGLFSGLSRACSDLQRQVECKRGVPACFVPSLRPEKEQGQSAREGQRDA